MNNSDNQPSDPEIDQAELVAYLDNELDDDARQRVERRLGEDPEYQEALQLLQRSWDCLDALPSVPTSERFTETTLEMVAQQARQDLDAAQRGDRPWLRSVAAGALAVVVLLGAFGIVFSAYRSAADHDLRELPMIDNLDLYRQVDSVQFLEKLNEADVVSPATDAVPLGGRVPLGEIGSDDLWTLRERAEDLTPLEKEQLRANRERFEQFSDAEQQRICDLHAELTSHPDRLQMHRALVQYSAWLAVMSVREQLDLKEMSIADRIDEIREIQQEQERKALVEFAITPEDAVAIERWLEGLAKPHYEKMRAQFSPEMSQRFDSKDPDHKRRMVIGMIYFSRRSRGIRPETAPTADQLQGLLKQLTPSVRDRLVKLEDPDEQFRMLVRWVGGYLRDRFYQVEKEKLEAFYHTLSVEQRNELDQMVPRRMQWELTRRYHRDRDHEQMGGPGGGGRTYSGRDDGPRRGGGGPRRRPGENGPSPEGRPPFDPDRPRPDRRELGPPPAGPQGPPLHNEARPPSSGVPQITE